MPRKLIVWLLGGAAILAGAFYLASDRSGDDPPAGTPPGAAAWTAARPPAVVTTAPVERGTFTVRSEFVGTLRANLQAELFARTPGPLVDMGVDTGDRVEAGQVLARIDPSEQLQKLEQTRAALKMAEATVAQRQAALTIARTTAERTAALYAQRLVPEQQRDAAEAELEGARAQLQVAQAQVDQARANISSAEVELDKTRIVAPFSGFVGKRHLDLGAYAAANRPIFTLVDLSVIKTTVSLTERDATHVRVGQAATLASEALGGRTFPGRVARIAAMFDPQTHTTEAEIEVDNPDRALKPGMFATVSIDFTTDPDALLVPKAAVVENESETYVFVAEAEAGSPRQGGAPETPAKPPAFKARRVPVGTLGSGPDGAGAKVAVEGDLAPGERVITLGQEDLRDGEPVTVSDGPPGSPQAAQPAL